MYLDDEDLIKSRASCSECLGKISRGCVQCGTVVAPSKFQIESRLCESCLHRSRVSVDDAIALSPNGSVDSFVFRQYSDIVASMNLTDSESVCSHEELLPMVMGYKADPDGRAR